MAIGLLGMAGITAGLGMATQLGGIIGGQIASNKANKQAEAELQARRNENKQWYNQKMNEDYMMRSDVQNVLRKQRELLNEQYQRARATNIVAGGTDESLALQQQAANNVMGDTMADIAANASAYKDNVEQQYRAAENNFSQQQQQIYNNKAQSIANAASQATQMGQGLVSGVANVAGNAMQNGNGITKVKNN